MIRFERVALRHFKNIDQGEISFPHTDDLENSLPSIIGIYGQNGSGKSSVVEAFALLQRLMSGSSLPSQAADYFQPGADSYKIELQIRLTDADDASSGKQQFDYRLIYDVEIARSANPQRSQNKNAATFRISHERLRIKNLLAQESLRTLIALSASDDPALGTSLSPTGDWKSLFTGRSDDRSQLMVQLALANERPSSGIFSYNVYAIVERALSEQARKGTNMSKNTLAALAHLHHYLLCVPALALNALENMAVISTSAHAEVSLNFLHIQSRHADYWGSEPDGIRLDLLAANTLDLKTFERLKQTIGALNEVIGTLVPGLSLIVQNHGRQALDNGETGVRAELFSQRGSALIPFRCESEGIKKIVSISTLLVNVYTNPSAFLAIDEFDSGIFEYLLGQIVETFSKYAKGQLLFTAHDLFPLEKLPKQSVVFATSSPSDKFITFTNIRKTNNLRDVYLRAIELEDGPAAIYNRTDRYEMDNAFYQAGQALKPQGVDDNE